MKADKREGSVVVPRRTLALAVIGALLCSLLAAGCGSAPEEPGTAQEPAGNLPIRVEGAWAQHTALREGQRLASGTNSVIYFRLENTGAEPDALVGVQTDVAMSCKLHETVVEGEVARMLPIDRIDLPAGETVELKRGGLHVMLLGVTRHLVPGDRFQAVLILEKAGEIPIEVEVRAG